MFQKNHSVRYFAFTVFCAARLPLLWEARHRYSIQDFIDKKICSFWQNLNILSLSGVDLKVPYKSTRIGLLCSPNSTRAYPILLWTSQVPVSCPQNLHASSHVCSPSKIPLLLMSRGSHSSCMFGRLRGLSTKSVVDIS